LQKYSKDSRTEFARFSFHVRLLFINFSSFKPYIKSINLIKDAPCVAPSRFTEKIFVVLVDSYHHSVLTMSFKLSSFSHLYR